MIKIISPLAVYLPRKTKEDKKMILNFNVVNGLHFIIYNDMKKIYTKMISEQLKGVKFNKVQIEFRYFKGSKRKCDRANVYSIHEKFFCDALVKCGCLEDDSDEFIIQSVYLPTKYDKEKPRVEIYVFEVERS